MRYSIREHKHRFASWAAGRAASVPGCRFSVEQAKGIIEACHLEQLLAGPNKLPSHQNMDRHHRKWRQSVIAAAQSRGLAFTHGVAAKLINVYLKSGFVCGGYHGNTRVQALHPPIDSMLLDQLSAKNVGGLRQAWEKARRTRWSKFDSQEYEELIANIRKSMLPNEALWKVEKYWPGHK